MAVAICHARAQARLERQGRETQGQQGDRAAVPRGLTAIIGLTIFARVANLQAVWRGYSPAITYKMH